MLVGGVNLNRDPREIRPDQLALSKNAFPVIPGILGKRQGFRGSRMAVIGGSNRFIPLDFGIAPPASGLQFISHFHKWDANPPTPSHLLVASSLDREDASFTKGVSQGLGRFQTEYEPCTFVQYRGKTLAVIPGMEGYYSFMPNKAGTAYEWVKGTFLWDPSLVAGQATQSTPVTPYRATSYKGRMVWGNFGPGRGNWLCWADFATTTTLKPGFGISIEGLIGPDALALNGRHVEVATLEGEDIVAMQEVTLASMGSQMDSFLMLLTNKSCVLVSGEITQTNDTDATNPQKLFGSYQENRVNYDCGCVSQRTLTKTPYGWIWASHDDVWIMSGNTPTRIGTNIRPALLACPANTRKYWSAAYANGVYVLQIVTAGSVAEAGADAGNMSTYNHQYWFLDLRDGQPDRAETARWYGPMEVANEDGNSLLFGPLLGITDPDGTQRIITQAMYLQSNNTYMCDLFAGGNAYDLIMDGTTSANQWSPNTDYVVGDIVRPRVNTSSVIASRLGRLFVCTTAGTSDSSDPAWPTTDGGTVVDNSVTWTEILGSAVGALGIYLQQRSGTEYQAEIRARDSLLEDMAHEKLVRRLDANISVSNRVNIQAQVIKNNGASISNIQTQTFDPASFEADVDSLSGVIGGVKGVSRAFRPTESGLIQCRHGQLKVQDKTGYVIDDSNDYFAALLMSQSGDFIAQANLQVQLTHGEYTTIDDVLTELVAQLNAVKGSIATQFGMTLGATPFSYTTAYGVTSPYFTKLNFAYTAAGTLKAIAPCYYTSDVTYSAALPLIGSGGTTAYLLRCKKLMAMLGYDTSAPQSGFDTPLDNANFGVSFNWQPFVLTSSPVTMYGASVVQQKNSQRFDLASATLLIQPKSAQPMTTIDRS